MKIKVIDQSSSHLSDVMILGKQNSKTLGMFPEGAFIDHARKKTIFVAEEDGKLMGYVLFRLTQSKRLISITHLCINPAFRKQGIAKSLLDAVKAKYGQLYKGISLSCRKDYEVASKFWEDYGFKAINTVRSRSKDENYLVKWHFDFGNIDLFSTHIGSSFKVKAVLDANVIMKLSDEYCSDNFETFALAADWLSDEVDYFYAPEIFNEINRDTNLIRADNTRKFVHTLHEARFNHLECELVLSELNNIISGVTVNAQSDRKQLAESISAKVDHFITLDSELLKASDLIYDKFLIKVLRPAEFILFIDQSNHGRDYRSYRLAGARHEYGNIRQDEIEKLTSNSWVLSEANEKKYQLTSKLTNVIADLQKSVFRLIKDNNGDCIGYFAIKFENTQLTIKLIRTIKSKISDILFQQLLKDILLLAIEKNCVLVLIDDIIVEDEKIQILYSFGFDYTPKGWYKIILTGQYSTFEILNNHKLVNEYWSTQTILSKIESLEGHEQQCLKLEIERKLWPLKFLNIDVPVYIVPIKPYWAGQLFDHYIADHTLFGAKPELSWSKENVYYRSVKPVSELAPSRILWYASSEPKSTTGREKSIIATSYLENVSVGPAKTLFQKYKNFGVYEWQDIYKLAGEDPQKLIKALKFIDTEVFKNPVPLGLLNKTLKQFGRLPNTFASPLEVSCDIFNEIYRLGKK